MGQQQLTLKDALNHVDQAVESDPGQWNALCPAHNDTSPSLSLRENERKLLLCCHTGCSYLEILEAIKARRTKASSRDPQLRPNSLAAVPAQANGRIEPKRIVGIKTPNPKKLKSCRKAKSDFAAEARRYESEITSDQLSQLVAGLGVSSKSLRSLHVGWKADASGKGVYTFPEFNGRGRVVGISTRQADGRKRSVQGSRRGIYLPVDWLKPGAPIVICEGASDTAGLVTMNVSAIGRPSAHGGGKHLLAILKNISPEVEIIVVGENDQKSDGKWPGRDGAEKIAKELTTGLNRPVIHSMPPEGVKDVREWFTTETKLRAPKKGGRNGS